MRVVTLEEHFTIPDLVKRIDPATVRRRGFAPPGEQPAAMRRESDLADVGAGRSARMDEGGVTVQVLAVAGPGADLVDGTVGVAVARDFNDYLAGAVARPPDRFAGFAHLPMRAPKAAEGVRRAYYDGSPEPVALAFAGPGWGWHAETAVHVLRRVLSGALDRHPGLKLIIGHMGKGLEAMMARVANVFGQSGWRAPSAGRSATKVWVTMSGFFARAPFLAAPPVSAEHRERMADGNADRLLGLVLRRRGRKARAVPTWCHASPHLGPAKPHVAARRAPPGPLRGAVR